MPTPMHPVTVDSEIAILNRLADYMEIMAAGGSGPTPSGNVAVTSSVLPTGAATQAGIQNLINILTQVRDNQSNPPAYTGLTDSQLRESAVEVSGPLTNSQLRNTPISVQGNVSTGGLTDSELRASPLSVNINGNVSTGGLTDSQLRASPVAVTGSVVTTALTDTELRATPVPVTGGLTDAQLRLSPVPVSGNISSTVTGSVEVSNTVAVSGPLTETQLRSAAVQISGAVTGPLTDAQLRNSPINVSGAVTGPLTDTQLRASAIPVSLSASPLPTGAATSALQIEISSKLPATLGQKTSSASLPVVLASDQGAVKTAIDGTSTSGGVVGYKVLSAASTNATSVKATAGRLYSAQFYNNATSVRYVKFYNLASAPTVGSSTIMSIVGVPPGGRATLSNPQGIYCSAGIAFSIVAGAADNDATAVAANDVVGSITYV